MRPKANPFGPASYSKIEVMAVKAVANGQASEEQQRVAMRWIIEKAAMTYDEMLVPGQPDVSNHLTGRRNVGLQIVKLVNTPLTQMKFPEDGGKEGSQ